MDQYVIAELENNGPVEFAACITVQSLPDLLKGSILEFSKGSSIVLLVRCTLLFIIWLSKGHRV